MSLPSSSPKQGPTSAPKPPSTKKDRRPKLRASCDACAASKVKCSKEHPICGRCSTNGSQCIYGVSRKHGKPGRTRKRNPDGTPFIKASKQRPSPNGSEFSKFRIRPEPTVHGLGLSDVDTSSNWSASSRWVTPEFEYEMQPEPLQPFYMAPPIADFTVMGNVPSVPTGNEPHPGNISAIERGFAFRDPFAKRASVQLELPDIPAVKDFIGANSANSWNLGFDNSASLLPDSSAMLNPNNNNSYFLNPLRVSVSMPSSHCCYTLAYTTLESLRCGPGNSEGSYPGTELKSLDSVLSITKTAVKNVLQLLRCHCSSDPHLAMLYSSIASKILTWYQIAAGVKPTTPPTPSLSSSASSPSESSFSSSISTISPADTAFSIQVLPLKIGVFEFDEAEQETLRRQVVLRELRKCGQLVDALVSWRGQGDVGQAESLYDVLGAWLKSELDKTLREMASEQL
ncbi:hypothetical protein BDV95DRAFT_484717 [Massariosphaeria phaeospora]|uniref:Zn(2)-C6 fungal-type domain-containing protein n=1 Tax=Massariosphaeria phaeospora TaxID=100035 RepID=A0A7C8MFK3_9PLEO|nr:hypothetical protein BDV95DRAFT_484717 [Massariosphaeria phaeospora]